MKNKKNSYIGVLDYALEEFFPKKAQYEIDTSGKDLPKGNIYGFGIMDQR